MQIGDTPIEDTYAEGFRMVWTRLVVTALDSHWAGIAAGEMCGYGTSVIGCDAEAGIESVLGETQTPDGRPGVALLMFGFQPDSLAAAVRNRVAQCAMTCPTTAVYSVSTPGDRFPLGRQLRYFGDGHQHSKLVGDERLWRIPVMDGEFLCSDSMTIAKGVAGGNFLIQAVDQVSGLRAASAAVESIASMPGVITPFPGGVVRSGSKVGSRYRGLRASTADLWCPTLRGRVPSRVAEGANCVYEIVIDGESEAAVSAAMATGIRSACLSGVKAIAAGNYGGKLGKFLFHLHQVLREHPP